MRRFAGVAKSRFGGFAVLGLPCLRAYISNLMLFKRESCASTDGTLGN